MLSQASRAVEICDEWFPTLSTLSPPFSGLYDKAKDLRIAQLKAELEHVFRQGYSVGYNDCVRENLAMPRNST